MLSGQVPQPTRRGKRVDNLRALADLDTPQGRRARENLRDQKSRKKLLAKRPLTPEQKAAEAAYQREYRRKNAEKIAANKQRWAEENADRVRVTRREWRRRRLAKLSPEARAVELEKFKQRTEAAKAKIDPEERKRRRREYDRAYRERRKHDPAFRAAENERSRRYQARKRAAQ